MTHSFTRYVTRTGVTINKATAMRLARKDQTEHIDVAHDVAVLHAQDNWALWSDDRVTTSTGLPDVLCLTRSLSTDAATLITAVYCSRCGEPPECAGGWRTLAMIERIERNDVFEEGNDETPRLCRVVVRLTNGVLRLLWVEVSPYAVEGFLFLVRDFRHPRVASAQGRRGG